MVKANEAASAIRSRFVSELIPEEVRDLASFSINLLDLMNAVVEGGILPMSAPHPPPSFASAVATATVANSKPRVEPGTAELKAALTAADKAAVVFDADLGASPVANRNILNGAFAAGLKAATMKVAESSGADAVEAIRVVNDALSCADNVEFLGQNTAQKIDRKDPAKPVVLPFCTMPVKLEFPDKNTRIHFEKTLRKQCNLKATISLPKQIRKFQSLFLNAMRERYPGKFVMARPDTASLSLIAFMKDGGASGWTRCQEKVPIPRGIMLPGAIIPNRVELPQVAPHGLGDDDDELLVEASIGAESQSVPTSQP
jgi:hypothetical protein